MVSNNYIPEILIGHLKMSNIFDHSGLRKFLLNQIAEPSNMARTVISRKIYGQLYKAYQDSKIPFEGRDLKTTPAPMHITCSVMELQKIA